VCANLSVCTSKKISGKIYLMTESTAERRMAENEVVFRNANRAIQEGFDKLATMSDEDGAEPVHVNPTMKLQFLCECSDENCTDRIQISLNDYNDIHTSAKRFIIIDGHDVQQIERIVERRDAYTIVEKYDVPPEDVDTLHSTSIDNS
jgi:hypothetical protein